MNQEVSCGSVVWAQELVAKAAALGARPDVRWHFLGAIQRNKVRDLAPLVHLWQTVEDRATGEEIAHRAPGAPHLPPRQAPSTPQARTSPP